MQQPQSGSRNGNIALRDGQCGPLGSRRPVDTVTLRIARLLRWPQHYPSCPLPPSFSLSITGRSASSLVRAVGGALGVVLPGRQRPSQSWRACKTRSSAMRRRALHRWQLLQHRPHLRLRPRLLWSRKLSVAVQRHGYVRRVQRKRRHAVRHEAVLLGYGLVRCEFPCSGKGRN